MTKETTRRARTVNKKSLSAEHVFSKGPTGKLYKVIIQLNKQANRQKPAFRKGPKWILPERFHAFVPPVHETVPITTNHQRNDV